MIPRYPREIKTRPLTKEEYDLIKDTVSVFDSTGVERKETLEEFNKIGGRVYAHRNIDTGEWEDSIATSHTKTPMIVIKAGR